MTISDKQFLMTAILSMDVYNRDKVYSSPEIYKALAALGSSFGGATNISFSFDPDNNFGAAAWSWEGQTIIVYRGTVSNTFPNFYKSASNGYGITFDSYQGPQAQSAIGFYQGIAFSHTNILVTGQSLGGGLAGLVGSIYGLNGAIYDNEPFERAAFLGSGLNQVHQMMVAARATAEWKFLASLS